MQFARLYFNLPLSHTIPLRIQLAGAHRKPIWLPVAKSKIYRIPKRPVISDEEKAELKRIHSQYKTKMRAIRRFYCEEMIRERSTLESATSELSLKVEAQEWEQCLELNEEWNKAIALEREDRWRAEAKAREEVALTVMERVDKYNKQKLEKASEEIRKQKVLCKTFITVEDLDEAIERALANPVDYNFAIDLQENRYLGRDTSITRTDTEKKFSSLTA